MGKTPWSLSGRTRAQRANRSPKMGWIRRMFKSAEQHPIYRWLAAVGTVKLGFALGASVAAVIVGLLSHIKPVYLLDAVLVAAGSGLWIANQFSARRALNTFQMVGATSSEQPEEPAHKPSTTIAQLPVPSYKPRATAEELAQSTITGRLVPITEVPTEADGFIRLKHFIDCDVIGPAVVFATRCDFAHLSFAVAGDSLESILWPVNPAAPTILGAIGMDQCRFEQGRIFHIGFAGGPEALDALRHDLGDVILPGQRAIPPPENSDSQ